MPIGEEVVAFNDFSGHWYIPLQLAVRMPSEIVVMLVTITDLVDGDLLLGPPGLYVCLGSWDHDSCEGDVWIERSPLDSWPPVCDRAGHTVEILIEVSDLYSGVAASPFFASPTLVLDDLEIYCGD